jgi:CRISPR/Cas system-associated exonuclease Cas4 (RecB family)
MKLDSCGEAYKLEYIGRKRPKVQDARNNVHGNALHRLLEEWLKRGEFDPQWMVDNARRCWDEQVAEEKLLIWRNDKDEQEVRDKTLKWAGVLAKQCEQYNIDPATCQAEFKADTDVKLGEHRIRLGGRIDILKTNKAGQKIVLDLKASVNRDIMKKEQLVWYATLVGLALKNHDEPVAAGYILPGLDEVIMHKITQEDKLALVNRIAAAAQRIVDMDFKAEPSQQKCWWCPVKPFCSVQGGVIPAKKGMLDLTDFA